MTPGRNVVALAGVLSLLMLAACAMAAPSKTSSTTSGTLSITLYTCANDDTVEAVIKNFQAGHAGTMVDLFRGTTGALNARVASDVADGGLKADVIWACDPLTMQDYVTQGLVGGWTPETKIAADLRTSDYVGVTTLYVVAVGRDGSVLPASWNQLRDSAKVAIPDPRVSAVALGALGYFGTPFYTALKRKGAVQLGTPDEVTEGVAQGTYDVGMTVASSAYHAAETDSGLAVSWPWPGAIAIYGPVALSKTTKNVDAAQALMSYLTSKEGQTVIGAAGSYPTLAGVPGPAKPNGAPVVHPDWPALASQKASLLSDYTKIFGSGS
jgi:iron(III) transport system substrate-binding protein